MRVQIGESHVTLWLSANDTYQWAHKPGKRWPCSQLSGKRLVACFDSNGLCDMAVNGRDGDDIDATEFNAITSDFLATKLPKDHPLWFITVGQFQRQAA